MNKQNKLILRVFKAALKVAEAAEKTRLKKETFGVPRMNNVPEPPTGKIPKGYYPLDEILKKRGEFIIHRGNGDPKKQGCEAVGPVTAKLLRSRDAEIERLEWENTALRKLLAANDPIGVREKDLQVIEKTGDEPILRGRWKAEDMPKKGITEKLILAGFAGDDTPYVEKLLKPLGDTPRTLVHLKSPELGTETLVVLSPEGETLLKIVKDNSRKFEVK